MADITHSRIPPKASDRWALVRNICAGGDAEVMGKYLPRLNRLDTSVANGDRNMAYRDRAVLYNATGRTRDGLLGLAFRRDPKGEDSLPLRLEYLTDNCDGAGVSIYQQSQATLKSILEVGRHGLYVDYSEALQGPIIKPYRAEDIVNWRSTAIEGKTVLSMVVLLEEAEVEDGYAVGIVPQWRELLLEDGGFVVRLWQKPEEGQDPVQIGEDIIPRSVGGRLDFIPFVFIGAQNNDASIDEAPLYDLAYVNRAHYRNSADYEDSVFLVGQAQPWISGLTEEWRDHLEQGGKTYTGSRAAMLLPQGGAYGFAQALPNSMAKEAMDQKEAQMIALGARLIDASQANRTATESDNDKEASTSVLSMCVANVSEAYTQAIEWCARYVDIALAEGEAQYAINQDFARMQAEPQIITALVGAWQSGAFAKPDLRAFLRRIGVIAVERTDAEIDADSEGEGPALGTMGDAVAPVTNAPVIGAQGDQIPAEPGAAQQPSATPTASSTQDNLQPLVDAVMALANRPEADLAPLIAAINAREAAVIEFDVQPIADAVAEAIKSIPAAVVNMPAQPAPVFNIDATTTVNQPEQQATVVNMPAITVEAPTVNIAPAAVTVNTPDVNVAPAAITVTAPIVNVAPAAVHVAAPAVPAKAREIKFDTNAAGDITGASMS